MAGERRLVDVELAELRRRAYGPDADIATDPVAQTRLRDLETREHQADAGPEIEQSASPGSPSTVATTAGSSSVRRHPTQGARTAASPAPLWREVSPWATALVATLLALIAVAALLATLFAPPRADLTLASRPWSSDVSVPGISTTTLHDWGIPPGALTYHGRVGAMDVWTMTGAMDAECLLLSVDGSFYRQSCEPSPLEPHIDVRADPELIPPGSIDPDVPEGSTVRVAASGAVVQIFTARPGAGDNPGGG